MFWEVAEPRGFLGPQILPSREEFMEPGSSPEAKSVAQMLKCFILS